MALAQVHGDSLRAAAKSGGITPRDWLALRGSVKTLLHETKLKERHQVFNCSGYASVAIHKCQKGGTDASHSLLHRGQR